MRTIDLRGVRLAFGALLAGMLAACAPPPTASSPPPRAPTNVVLIIGDDISPDFGAYGGAVDSPHFDALAQDGVLFANAYTVASSCSPSRISMLTGRYPHNHGAPELHMPMPEGQVTLSQALSDAGYYLAASGKWHMGDAAKADFDLVHAPEYPEDITGAEGWVPALRDRPRDRPFFMWFGAYDAHRPWEADPEETPYGLADGALPAGIPDTAIARADLAQYYDEVRRFDRYVGKVVDELASQGVLDNTMIIVVGDNGRPFPRNKTHLFDNGMKVPLMVHWPAGGLDRGSQPLGLVSTIDLAPTILSLLGLEVPAMMQGRDFSGALRDADAPTSQYVFGERNWHTQRGIGRMVRHGDLTYFRNFTPEYFHFLMVNNTDPSFAELLRLRAEGGLAPHEAELFATDLPVESLYDVNKDPQQLVNLAADPAYRADLVRMRALLAQWQERTGDSIPEASLTTPDRRDRASFKDLFGPGRPSGGIVAGETSGATKIADPGPR